MDNRAGVRYKSLKACRGLSVVEVLIGIVLFVLLFTQVMTAFAPTATDYQGMVRGFTTAINVANWYINRVEGIINLEGSLPSSETGLQKDVTDTCRAKFGDAMMVELKEVKVTANVFQISKGLYQIDVALAWKGRGSNLHNYSMSRLKTAPSF